MARCDVELDRMGCCALMHAYLRNLAQARRWAEFAGPLQILGEISHSTLGMRFQPDEQMVMLLRAFATHEIRRLKTSAADRLMCRHGAAVHLQRLEDLLCQLPPNTAN